MKRTWFMMGTLTIMLAFATEIAHAQISLDDAIRDAATRLVEQSSTTREELIRNFGSAPIAVVAVDSDSTIMSDHIIGRLISALLGVQGVQVVERAQLQQIFAEQDLQMDARFDDFTAASIAGGAGAHFIVMGSFQRVLNFYDFRLRIINVNNHIIVGAYETHVQDSTFIRNLLGTDFTTGERWGTMGMNIIPGLGSLIVMNDTFGGVVQFVVGGAGWGLFIASVGNITRDIPNPLFPGSYTQETNTAALIGTIAGGVLVAGQLVFNIVRSSTYMRPTVRTAAVLDPGAWNVALVPGANGVEGVSVSHTLRF